MPDVMALGPAPRTAEEQWKSKVAADWHRVRVASLSAPVCVPFGLRVRPVSQSDDRDVVTIDEDLVQVFSPTDNRRVSLKGKTASVPFVEGDDGVKRSALVDPAGVPGIESVDGLVVTVEYDPDRTADGLKAWGLNTVVARITLSRGAQTLVEANGVFQHERPIWNLARLGDRVTVPDGEGYPLLPRMSNANGADQLTAAPHAWSWWLIDHEWQRGFNLHPGTLSEGCATVAELDKWEEFYRFLAVGRFDGLNRHAAELTVRRVATPRRAAALQNRTAADVAVYEGAGPPFTLCRLPAGTRTPDGFAGAGVLVPAGQTLGSPLFGPTAGPVPVDARGDDRCEVTAAGGVVSLSAAGRPGAPAADWPVVPAGGVAGLPAVAGAVPLPAAPAPPASAFVVPRGQLTFDAEGREEAASPFFSRHPHVPRTVPDTSGLTIGRGYDVKTKTAAKVRADMAAAGIPAATADAYAGAVGLQGEAARRYVAAHAVPGIDPDQQMALFLISYDDAAADVRRISEKADVVAKYGATDWDALDPRIKDVLVDLRFRGDYRGSTRKFVQPHVVGNDPGGLRAVLNDPDRWHGLNVPRERFRARAEYLWTDDVN